MLPAETSLALESFLWELERGGSGREIAERIRRIADEEVRPEVAALLRRTSDDIEQSVGDMQTEILPDGVAGQAYQGTDNAVVDLTKTLKTDGDSLIDADCADDIRRHEKRHGEQTSSPNAQVIQRKGELLSWLEVSEFDAIEAQKAPNRISDEYRRIHSKVARLLGRDAARKAAVSGDLASWATAA
jgi:hypothetical protein